MNEMYALIDSLCKERKINMTQMCREASIPRGNLTDLKNGRTSVLSTKNLQKLSSYFGVSLDFLLGVAVKEKAPAESGRCISDADLKFALWGNSDIDDSVLDDVKRFAKFAEENRNKNEKG